jgi:hypothetical protein
LQQELEAAPKQAKRRETHTNAKNTEGARLPKGPRRKRSEEFEEGAGTEEDEGVGTAEEEEEKVILERENVRMKSGTVAKVHQYYSSIAAQELTVPFFSPSITARNGRKQRSKSLAAQSRRVRPPSLSTRTCLSVLLPLTFGGYCSLARSEFLVF